MKYHTIAWSGFWWILSPSIEEKKVLGTRLNSTSLKYNKFFSDNREYDLASFFYLGM